MQSGRVQVHLTLVCYPALHGMVCRQPADGRGFLLVSSEHNEGLRGKTPMNK